MMNVKIEDLKDFDEMIGFWGGARTTWDSLSEDEKDILENYVLGMEFESLTAVNDFIWFEAEDILADQQEEEEPDEPEIEMGFDPYEGCYTYDC